MRFNGKKILFTTINLVNSKLQAKTVTEGGKVTPDAGFDGLSEVNVNINNKFNKIVDGTITEVTSEDLKDYSLICKGAFYGCANLKSVHIPSNIKSIGDSAFNFCTALENLIIDEGVETIEANAIGNTKLTSITIPNSVKTIGDQAFLTNSVLTELTIGSGCTNIGGWFLNGSYSCTKITCLATTPPTLHTSTFSMSAGNKKFYVPKGTLSAYENAEVWKNYAGSFIELES